MVPYKNIINGQDALIIGSGRSVADYYDKIVRYIKSKSVILLGINYMTDFFVPHYHLWTNKQRYRDLGSCIKTESTMMFGQKIPDKLIKKHHNGFYYSVIYEDNIKLRNSINITEEGHVKGFFRNAGSLAVALLKVMGAKSINLVGVDGFSLYTNKELVKGDKNQHCYGKGFTDDASYKQCIEKDKYIYDSYRTMKKHGIDFKILTPTKYEEFYDSEILKNI